jgi:hypothetical protein
MSWVALFTKGWLCRLRFLGKVLIVERANQPNANNAHVKPQDQLVHGVSQVPSAGSQNQKNPTSTAEPIAPKLGVDYPFPPHLEYVISSQLHYVTLSLDVNVKVPSRFLNLMNILCPVNFI